MCARTTPCPISEDEDCDLAQLNHEERANGELEHSDRDASVFFAAREYKSKSDIVDAVVEYHSIVLRPYKVCESDKRRYKAICVVPSCPFVVRFGFSSRLKGPTLAVSHNCPLDPTCKGANKKWTAKNLANNIEVRELFAQVGRVVTPIAIQRRVGRLGYAASYQNCVNAFKRLTREFYGDEFEQYRKLPSYATLLTSIGHYACCEVHDGKFLRFAVLYRKGLHAFRQYAARGIC